MLSLVPPSLTPNTPIRYGLSVVTPPAAEPVSLVRAKRHLRVDHDDEDDDITDLVVEAREHIERVCNIAIVTQTLLATYDYFPPVIRLPRAPLISVGSVKYLNDVGTGTLTTLAVSAYQVDVSRQPGRLMPAADTVWPDTHWERLGAVQVTYTAGYGDTNATPKALIRAILLLIGHWYIHREAVAQGTWNELPQGVRNVLSSFWTGWLA